MKKAYIAIAILVIMAAYNFTIGKKTLSQDEVRSSYDNKVVLICGASSGIGEEVVYQLAEVGARIMIVARRENRLVKVKEEALKRGSPKVEYIVYDFSDVKNVSKIVDKTINSFGRLDYLIANHASIVGGTFLAFPHLHAPEFIAKHFRINTFSIIELALKSLPHLEASSGHIFITSSLGGEVPISAQNHIYFATKHALNGFFYSLQSELIFKKSKVGLTVGAFGFIVTEDLSRLMVSIDSIPSIFKGSVSICAKNMVEAYIERQRTITYPTSNWITRLLWLLHPKFHEAVVHEGGYFHGNYEDSIQQSVDMAKKANEIGFQEGYYDGFIKKV